MVAVVMVAPLIEGHSQCSQCPSRTVSEPGTSPSTSRVRRPGTLCCSLDPCTCRRTSLAVARAALAGRVTAAVLAVVMEAVVRVKEAAAAAPTGRAMAVEVVVMVAAATGRAVRARVEEVRAVVEREEEMVAVAEAAVTAAVMRVVARVVVVKAEARATEVVAEMALGPKATVVVAAMAPESTALVVVVVMAPPRSACVLASLSQWNRSREAQPTSVQRQPMTIPAVCSERRLKATQRVTTAAVRHRGDPLTRGVPASRAVQATWIWRLCKPISVTDHPDVSHKTTFRHRETLYVQRPDTHVAPTVVITTSRRPAFIW